MLKKVKLSLKLSSVLLAGTFFIVGSDTLEEVNLGQALLGPLSEAGFKIYDQRSGAVIHTGTTTKGDGTDIATAGLIKVPQTVLDTLKSKLYRIEVTGGTDIDADDDGVWDSAPTPNSGTLHSLMSGNQIKKGDFKVNILNEIVYQNVKDKIDGSQSDNQIEQMLDDNAEELLKANGGDVNGDGKIDNQDLVDWDPSKDKDKLAKDYESDIKPIADAVHDGAEPKSESENLMRKDLEDTNGDGIPDTFYTYDEVGNLIKVEFDRDNDGTIDDRSDYTYYPDGKLKTDSWHGKMITYTYDSQGRKIKEVWNFYHGETIIDTFTNTYIYNNDGNVFKGMHDEGSDGTIDSITTCTYYSNGERASCESDYDNDGIIDSKCTFDEEGKRLTVLKNIDADEALDLRTNVYNSSGQRIQQTVDYKNDGSIDQINTHDPETGNLIKSEFSGNKNGILDEVTTYTYDASGHMLTEFIDYDNDGTIDRKNIYTYHSNGERASFSRFNATDLLTKWTYNENGQLLSYLGNHNGDGVKDLETYTYHSNGTMASRKMDFSNDGSIDIVINYDENGNEI